jgi:REP element-mobilizing transposase RayT
VSDYEDYCALIKLLNTDDASRHSRRKHRLPADCYSLSDCEYFFTLCARHKGTPFTEPELAVAVVESLLWRKEQHHWRLYTLCLMPDHLHFLLSLEPHQVSYINGGARGILPEGILNQVAGFKSFTTTQVWWKQGGKGRLWQRSSYDRVIRYNRSHSGGGFLHPEQPGSERHCQAVAGVPVFTNCRSLVGAGRCAGPSSDQQTANGNATAGVPYVVPLSMSHARKRFRKAPFVVQIS